MFGYVVPDEGELKVKDLALYRAHYCGLCKAIGTAYGPSARLFLNYDCAFLALFLSGLTEAPQCVPGSCFRHAGTKRPIAPPQPALDYAAAVNVLLAYARADDDRRDEKRMLGTAAKVTLSGARKKAAACYPVTAQAISVPLEDLAALEARNEACTDAPADAFGRLMRGLIGPAPGIEERFRPAAEWMFYQLGRWIYLIDAWDDREKDVSSGNYNPFLAAKTKKDDALFLINLSLTEAEKGYDLIPVLSHKGPLDNIMHQGLRLKTELITKEKANESV